MMMMMLRVIVLAELGSVSNLFWQDLVTMKVR